MRRRACDVVGWKQLSAVLLFCAVPGQALGQARDWVKEMFKESTHDFGVVARGAKVEYSFVVENNNEEDIRIESVSSSCGCSTPRVTKQVLKSWETAEIVVTLDTRGFTGRKDATITVKFAPPFAAEFQLHVHANIRGDIVVQPGAVEFGSVSQGRGPTNPGDQLRRPQRLEDRAGAMRRSAHRNQPRRNRPHARTGELQPFGEAQADAPPGYIRDQLTLVTNDFDPRAARVPVAIEGLVASALTVRPSPLMMGVVEAGKPVTRNLVVQGQTPFRILAVPLGRRPFPVQSVYGSEGRAYPARHLSRQGRHFRRRAALREDPH